MCARWLGTHSRAWATWLQHRNFFFFAGVRLDGAAQLVYLSSCGRTRRTETVGGFAEDEFIAYCPRFHCVVNQAHLRADQLDGGDKIRDGNAQAPAPLLPIFDAWRAVAGKIVFMLFVVPVAGVLAMLLKPDLNPSCRVLLFLPCRRLRGLALRFLWGFWLASLDHSCRTPSERCRTASCFLLTPN